MTISCCLVCFSAVPEADAAGKIGEFFGNSGKAGM